MAKAFDKIEELFLQTTIEDYYSISASGKKYYFDDEILAYLLWREIVFCGANGQIYINYSDVYPDVPIKRKDLPGLLEVYMKEEFTGVCNWIKENKKEYI